MLDYQAFRRQQAEARKQGRYLGVGVVSYIEICGLGPVAGGGRRRLRRRAVRLGHRAGVSDRRGAGLHRRRSPHGQGEETTFAQIVAEEFGYPVENVEIVHGRHRDHPAGLGHLRQPLHGGLRLGGEGRGQRVKEKAKKIAAHLLEANEQDIEWKDDAVPRARVAGDQAKTLRRGGADGQRRAGTCRPASSRGSRRRPSSTRSNFVYPFGTHICTVEVDVETGEVKILRYIAVDDCGPHINPMIVEGQIHGGVIQGLGEALQEIAIYDDDGQLVTGTMMDYAVPQGEPDAAHRDSTTPSRRRRSTRSASRACGEAGTIALGGRVW